MSGSDGGDPFLARWAARKTEALKRARRDGAPPEQEAAPAEEANADALREADRAEMPVPEDLKDVDPEHLDPETTDFSRFLKEDVPERLQRAALRRLWNSDETLANLDGLNDYDEDFTPAGMAAAAADFFRRTAEVLLEEEEGTPAGSGPREDDLADAAGTARAERPDAGEDSRTGGVAEKKPSADT